MTTVQAIGDILIPLGVCVALPVLTTWLAMRAKINKDNVNKDILISALDKNPDIDVEQFLKKINPPKKEKLLKEKLLEKLLWAIICLVFGVIGAGIGIYMMATTAISDGSHAVGLFFFAIGGCILAVGIAFLINYYVGEKMLAQEIEAEERQKNSSSCD